MLAVKIAMLEQPRYSPELAPCDVLPHPQAQGGHQGDPFKKRGRHQKSRDDGAPEDPGRILPGVRASVTEKIGKERYTAGALLRRESL